jgi:MYXO-CTERM domain-containing protein
VSARRIGVAAAAAFAVLAAAGPAAAFVRSTTASNDPTAAGACLWWGSPTVTFEVATDGLDLTGCASADAAAALIEQSFGAWSKQSCSSLRYVYGGTAATTAIGNDKHNIVVMRKGFCRGAGGAPLSTADQNNCWVHENAGSRVQTIALTTTTFEVDTGKIVDADMELRGWSGNGSGSAIPSGGSANDGWYFTCSAVNKTCSTYAEASCKYMDIGTTVTHEAGHVLGLDHVCVYPDVPDSTCAGDAVMNATASVGAINRTLAPDDVNGVCAIYPAGKAPDPLNGCLAKQAAAQTSGGGGCATGTPGAIGLVGLALLALRRRRPR